MIGGMAMDLVKDFFAQLGCFFGADTVKSFCHGLKSQDRYETFYELEALMLKATQLLLSLLSSRSTAIGWRAQWAS